MTSRACPLLPPPSVRQLSWQLGAVPQDCKEESKSHSCPQEDMANYRPASLTSANPGNNFQAHERQEGGQEKSAQTYKGEMVLN